MNTHRKITARTEPVLTTAGITAVVAAVIALTVAFDIELSEVQTTAILGVVGVLAPLVVTVARRQLFPNDKVVELDDGGMIVAGPGHDTLAEGSRIRAVHVTSPGPTGRYVCRGQSPA